MNIETSTLHTARLALRPLKESDAAVLYRIYQSPGLLQYFPNPHPPSLDKVQRFISGQHEHWQQYGYGDWGILPEGENEIAGWAGLQFLPELNETEVGFVLDRPFWGLGYATEAAIASLRFGFENASLGYIIALVHPENVASIRVIEKCKMGYVDCIKLWGIELRRYQITRSAGEKIT